MTEDGDGEKWEGSGGVGENLRAEARYLKQKVKDKDRAWSRWEGGRRRWSREALALRGCS